MNLSGFVNSSQLSFGLNGLSFLPEFPVGPDVHLLHIVCNGNPLLSALPDLTDYPNVNILNARGCSFSESVVDDVLIALAAGMISTGLCRLDQGSSSPPSSSGLAAAMTLLSRGWTVDVNV